MKDFIKIYKEKIDILEAKIGKYFNEKLHETNATKEQLVRNAIINDTIDLMEDMYRDQYFIDITKQEPIADAKTFRPYFYYYNILERVEMIFERLVILTAIAYKIDIDLIFEKKSINPLYDLVIKNKNIDNVIIENFSKYNNNFGFLKQERNKLEHFLPLHLIQNNIIKLNDTIIDRIFNKKIVDNLIEVFSNIIIKCIDVLYKLKLSGEKIEINCERFVLSLYKLENSIINIENISILNNQYNILSDRINKLLISISKMDEEHYSNSTKLILTALENAIYRAREVAMNLNKYIGAVWYEEEHKSIYADITTADVKKYYSNDVISSDYYYFSKFRLYQVYENLSKFIAYHYEIKFDKENEYTTENIVKKLEKDGIGKNLNFEESYKWNIFQYYMFLMASERTNFYFILRNTEYHNLRQNYYYMNNEINFDLLSYVYVWLSDIKSFIERCMTYEESIYHKLVKM